MRQDRNRPLLSQQKSLYFTFKNVPLEIQRQKSLKIKSLKSFPTYRKKTIN